MSHSLILRQMIYASTDYQKSLHLREEILRIPLGLRLTPEELARDRDDIHLGAFEADQLIACLILSKLSPTRIKMRQVAVLSNRQGRGIGSLLVEFSEKVALANQIYEIELSARHTAVDFYLGLDYQVQGEAYSEHHIPHVLMIKKLRSNSGL